MQFLLQFFGAISLQTLISPTQRRATHVFVLTSLSACQELKYWLSHHHRTPQMNTGENISKGALFYSFPSQIHLAGHSQAGRNGLKILELMIILFTNKLRSLSISNTNSPPQLNLRCSLLSSTISLLIATSLLGVSRPVTRNMSGHSSRRQVPEQMDHG